MSEKPFGIVELCQRVGEDHINVQPLLEVVTNVRQIGRPKKRGAPYHPGIAITFVTDQATVSEIGGFSAIKMIPLVVWFPADRVEQAKQDRTAEASPSVSPEEPAQK